MFQDGGLGAGDSDPENAENAAEERVTGVDQTDAPRTDVHAAAVNNPEKPPAVNLDGELLRARNGTPLQHTIA